MARWQEGHRDESARNKRNKRWHGMTTEASRQDGYRKIKKKTKLICEKYADFSILTH